MLPQLLFGVPAKCQAKFFFPPYPWLGLMLLVKIRDKKLKIAEF
jgi:hypothetical protein